MVETPNEAKNLSIDEFDIHRDNVIIIGGGFGGIGMACQLKRRFQFTDFTIIDKAPEMGGTWYWNSYPGAGCDIPTIMYSFSFEPNYNWTSLWVGRKELYNYIQDIVKKYDLKSHFKGGTLVEKCEWDNKTNRWSVHLKDLSTGVRYVQTGKALVMAPGGLSVPNECPLPGMETFKGEIFHSSRWPSDLSIRDKKVVIIGNGCSAAQIIPAIVEDTKSIVQFIRSAHNIIPRPLPNKPFSAFLKFLFKWMPLLHKFIRMLIFLILDTDFLAFVHRFKWFRDRKEREALKFLHSTAPKKYIDILTPNFTYGSKRRIIDAGYLKSLHNNKITLTNLSLEKIVKNGVVTKNGELYEADVICYATGFKVQEFASHFPIIGSDGISLHQRWENQGVGARAYKGGHISTLPNCSILVGPNTAQGHHSIIHAIESQINHTLAYLQPLIHPTLFSPRKSFITVTEEAEQAYNDWIQDSLKKLIWNHEKVGGWYIHEKTGTNSTVFPHFQSVLWWKTRFINWRDFKTF